MHVKVDLIPNVYHSKSGFTKGATKPPLFSATSEKNAGNNTPIINLPSSVNVDRHIPTIFLVLLFQKLIQCLDILVVTSILIVGSRVSDPDQGANVQRALTVEPRMAQTPMVFSSTRSAAFLGSMYKQSSVHSTSRPSISR